MSNIPRSLANALGDCRRRLGPEARITARETAGLYEVRIYIGELRHGDTPRWGVAAYDLAYVLDELPRGSATLVAEEALIARRRPLTGRLDGPTLLSPGAAGVFVHECFGHSSEADNYLANTPETGRLGDRLTTAPLTIRDRPGLTRYAGSYYQDDEGTPARTVTLVSGGLWTGLLTGQATAWLSGGRSTGHSRGAPGTTLPRCSVLQANRGRYAPDQLLRCVSDGWLLGSPLGGYSVRELLVLEILWVRRVRDGLLTDEVRGPAVICASKRGLAAEVLAVGNDLAVFSSPYRCIKGSHAVGSTLISPSLLLRRCVLRPLAELDRLLGRVDPRP